MEFQPGFLLCVFLRGSLEGLSHFAHCDPGMIHAAIWFKNHSLLKWRIQGHLASEYPGQEENPDSPTLLPSIVDQARFLILLLHFRKSQISLQ